MISHNKLYRKQTIILPLFSINIVTAPQIYERLSVMLSKYC
ncbi:hypothetical protein HMPREF3203_01143 [Proteus mirabilis]|nr:hypothetical protein HMPREF3203_01143 [Proteus mirabilis]